MAITVFIPPELQPMERDLHRFFDAMIFKLRKNAHKGKWEDQDLNSTFELMEKEVRELNSAVIEGSSVEVLMEAADVANFAMIIANVGLDGA